MSIGKSPCMCFYVTLFSSDRDWRQPEYLLQLVATRAMTYSLTRERNGHNP